MHAIRLSILEKRAAVKFENIETRNREVVELYFIGESAYLVMLKQSLLSSYHGEGYICNPERKGQDSELFG